MIELLAKELRVRSKYGCFLNKDYLFFFSHRLGVPMKKWLIQKQCYYGWNTKYDINRKEKTTIDETCDDATRLEVLIHTHTGIHRFTIVKRDFLSGLLFNQINGSIRTFQESFITKKHEC